jgi:hypothetical protein
MNKWEKGCKETVVVSQILSQRFLRRALPGTSQMQDLSKYAVSA